MNIIHRTDGDSNFGHMYISLRERIKSWFNKYPKLWNALQSLKSIPYVYNYLRYYIFPSSASSIREINIEFASACNLRCVFCSLDHDKPNVNMPLSTLVHLLDEVTLNPRFKNVEVLNLYNGGETLLHPNRLEMFEAVAEGKSKAKQIGKKFPKVLMLTNGMLLREKLAEQILRTGALDTIQFSFDGGTEEKFEQLRANAKWDKFYENVKRVHELRKDVQPDLQMKSITIVEKEYDLETTWMDEQFKELISYMDHYELRRLHDWGGEVEIGESVSANNFKIGCSMLMHQMVVLPNGDVTVCCNDLNSKGVVGNLNDNTLEEIYKGKHRITYLDKLLKGKRQELELCRNCQSF